MPWWAGLRCRCRCCGSGTAGVALSQGYGLTEASPNVLCLTNEDPERMVGYSGKPYPPTSRGPLPIRSPVRFSTAPPRVIFWWAAPGFSSATSATRPPRLPSSPTAGVLADGWLRTGDLVERDADGYIRVVDRLKDIYISGGENVAPAEVEAVLLVHPQWRRVPWLVFTMKLGRKRSGLCGGARRHGHRPAGTAGTLRRPAHLSAFKVPARISMVGALRRTALN